MTSGKSARVRLAILLIISALIAYSTVLGSYFLSDDFVVVGKLLEGDWSVQWGREHGGFFRPVFVWSNILDSLVWGANPTGYHLTNVLLHAASAFLVHALAARLVQNQSLSEELKRGVSWAASLLFLVHPSHTEAVSWIAGRADPLATLFSLAAILAYLSYKQERSTLHLIVALIAFALALFAKEAAASLPLVLLAVEIISPLDENRRASIKEMLKNISPFFLVLLVFIVVRGVALGSLVGGYGAGQHLNFAPSWLRDRLIQAAVRSLLPPFPQALSPILLKPLKSPAFLLVAVAFITTLVLLLARRRRLFDSNVRRNQNRLVMFLVVAFILSLLPVINLRLSMFDTQGERFVYWPSVFASISIAFVAATLFRSAKVWLILVACVFVFYSISLYRANQTWSEAAALSRIIRDDLALSATQKNILVINAPDNLRGVPVYHNGLERALRVFQPRGRIESMSLIALHDLSSAGDEFELKREGATLSLRTGKSASGFVKIAAPLSCVEILESSEELLRFRLNACSPELQLFFFSRGRMYKVLDHAESVASP